MHHLTFIRQFSQRSLKIQTGMCSLRVLRKCSLKSSMYLGKVFSPSPILSCKNQIWITRKDLLKSLNPSTSEVINLLGLFFNINTLYTEAGLYVATAKFTSYNTYRCLVLLVNFDGLVCFRR